MHYRPTLQQSPDKIKIPAPSLIYLFPCPQSPYSFAMILSLDFLLLCQLNDSNPLLSSALSLPTSCLLPIPPGQLPASQVPHCSSHWPSGVS